MSRLLSLPLLGIAHAVNPLASGGAMIGGLADPHAHVWSASADRVHIYATQDELSGNGTCCTGDWWIWSSADLIDWVPESQLPYFPWEPAELQTEFWATDAIERAGRFYWYVSVGGSQVAVATSETPTGPWSDPLGAPLLNKSLGDSLDPPTSIRDPGALADDDGNYYLVFGACSGEQQPDDSCYYLAQLNDDMISVQPPQHLSVKNAMGPYGPGKADDKPFLHKRGDIYYLSWGCFYGVSDDVYGPYEYQGSFISPDLIEPSFRYGNASQVPWYTQGDYADRHGSFLNFHGQSYWFGNDRSHANTTAWAGSFRDTVAAYVHYNDNGTIAPVVIDGSGIGQYDARHSIEAETFFAIDGAAEKRELRGDGGGFQVALHAGSSLSFPHVRLASRTDSSTVTTITLRVANGRTTRGSTGIRVYSACGSAGELYGECALPPTGGWTVFAEVSCVLDLPPNTAELDLCLQMFGDSEHGELARVDRFAISHGSKH